MRRTRKTRSQTLGLVTENPKSIRTNARQRPKLLARSSQKNPSPLTLAIPPIPTTHFAPDFPNCGHGIIFFAFVSARKGSCQKYSSTRRNNEEKKSNHSTAPRCPTPCARTLSNPPRGHSPNVPPREHSPNVPQGHSSREDTPPTRTTGVGDINAFNKNLDEIFWSGRLE